MNARPPSPRLAGEQQRARYRMLLFVRFLRGQKPFLHSHGMHLRENGEPRFREACRAMRLEPALPLPCLLECDRSRLPARIALGFLCLLTACVFWLDFFAGKDVLLPGGMTGGTLTLLLLIGIVFLLAFVLHGLLRRDALLFEAEGLAVCRRRLLFWNVRRIARAAVRDVVSVHRGHPLRARRLELVFHDGSALAAAFADDDATVTWLRWVLLRWLGRDYADEEGDAAPSSRPQKPLPQ